MTLKSLSWIIGFLLPGIILCLNSNLTLQLWRDSDLYFTTSLQKFLSEGVSSVFHLRSETQLPSQGNFPSPPILVPFSVIYGVGISLVVNKLYSLLQASYKANRFLFNQQLQKQNFIIMKFINQRREQIFTVAALSTLPTVCRTLKMSITLPGFDSVSAKKLS